MAGGSERGFENEDAAERIDTVKAGLCLYPLDAAYRKSDRKCKGQRTLRACVYCVQLLAFLAKVKTGGHRPRRR